MSARPKLNTENPFGFTLPYDRTAAATAIEQAVLKATGTKTCVVLFFDEDTGAYTPLQEDEPEIPLLSDHFLRERLGSDSVLQVPLVYPSPTNPLQPVLLGIVAVANKRANAPFTLADEQRLEQYVPALTEKLLEYRVLKDAMAIAPVQNALLDLSRTLIQGVDRQTVVFGLLHAMLPLMSADIVQYIHFEHFLAADVSDTQAAWVYALSRHNPNQLHTQHHQNLQAQLKEIQALSSLFVSRSWQHPYLQVHDHHFGGRSLSDCLLLNKAVLGRLNPQTLQRALIVPIYASESAGGHVLGLLNLFSFKPHGLKEEQQHILTEAISLISLALERSSVYDCAMAMSQRDELTDLLNRRGFNNRFQGEWSRAQRSQEPLTVALLDIDHFKAINDTYGHGVGDLILAGIARLLEANLRRSDVVARYGGEEFALLLPQTPLPIASRLLDRLRKKVAQHEFEISELTLTLTVSMGVMALTDWTQPAEAAMASALKQADTCLYQAKHKGRNRLVSFS